MDNLLLEQYKIYVDLFKFYLDTALTANIWFYAITGAILTHYFANAEKPLVRYSLLLPMVVSFSLVFIFGYGLVQALDMKAKIEMIASDLHLRGTPHVDVLILFLGLCILLFLAVGFVILYLFKRPASIQTRA